MIISMEDARSIKKYKDMDDRMLQHKLDAIEGMIRSYTNNNFQNRLVRFCGSADGRTIEGTSPFLRVGDTIQISESVANNGLYVITDIDDETITVNRPLYFSKINLITKIQYPQDIKDGVLNLLQWEADNRDKVGIKSETLSRHSVTYYDQDTNNTVMGYPVALLGFLKPYKKVRF